MIQCSVCETTEELERHHVQTTLTGDSGKYNKTKEIISLCRNHHYKVHNKKLNSPNKMKKIRALMKELASA